MRLSHDKAYRVGGRVGTLVARALADYPGSSVVIVGHSLGGAIAILNALSIRLRVPDNSFVIRAIVYGAPRVGNQAFANLVDQQLTNLYNGTGLTRINNKNDPVPIVPGIEFLNLGYHHPSGEVRIQTNGEWRACPGEWHLICLIS